MKKTLLCFIVMMISTSTVTLASLKDSITSSSFGKSIIYIPKDKKITSVALFISGDGGWEKGVVDMSEYLTQQGAIVVGLDILNYYQNLSKSTNECSYPAADLENISKEVQQKLSLETYFTPIIIGYSSGATLAYGVIVQAPQGTFKGALSLGFCPDIELSKPLCRGNGLKYTSPKKGTYILEASPTLQTPFTVLLGVNDQICNFNNVQEYLKKIPSATLISLPKVGHGFAVTANWKNQYLDAYKNLSINIPSTITDSQLIKKTTTKDVLSKEYPLNILEGKKSSNRKTMALMISGDGGWTGFDNSIASTIAEEGIPVVGLDALKYFWKKKEPQQVLADMSEVLTFYMNVLNKETIILIGYSYGACMIPFIASGLNNNIKSKISKIVCISPDETSDWDIHLLDILGQGKKETQNVVKEVAKYNNNKILCLFGDKEDTILREKFANTGAQILILKGNHHYNNNGTGVGESIINALPK